MVNNDIQMPVGIANPLNIHAFILQTGLYKKFGDERVEKNNIFDPGPIVNLRLIYNLPL